MQACHSRAELCLGKQAQKARRKLYRYFPIAYRCPQSCHVTLFLPFFLSLRKQDDCSIVFLHEHVLVTLRVNPCLEYSLCALVELSKIRALETQSFCAHPFERVRTSWSRFNRTRTRAFDYLHDSCDGETAGHRTKTNGSPKKPEICEVPALWAALHEGWFETTCASC